MEAIRPTQVALRIEIQKRRLRQAAALYDDVPDNIVLTEASRNNPRGAIKYHSSNVCSSMLPDSNPQSVHKEGFQNRLMPCSICHPRHNNENTARFTVDIATLFDDMRLYDNQATEVFLSYSGFVSFQNRKPFVYHLTDGCMGLENARRNLIRQMPLAALESIGRRCIPCIAGL